jgi:hypothetical protein
MFELQRTISPGGCALRKTAQPAAPVSSAVYTPHLSLSAAAENGSAGASANSLLFYRPFYHAQKAFVSDKKQVFDVKANRVYTVTVPRRFFQPPAEDKF